NEFLRLRVADVDGDHRNDIVVHEPPTVNVFTDRIYFAAGRGDGTFSEGIDPPVFARLHDFEVADVYRDGQLDVIGLVNSPGGLVVLRGNGIGSHWESEWHPAGEDTVGAFGDFDADGLLDVAVSSRLDGTVTTFLNVAHD
ncbi:MAG: VCBS repeat-containing protein, partial [Planctomycetota bacterium]